MQPVYSFIRSHLHILSPSLLDSKSTSTIYDIIQARFFIWIKTNKNTNHAHFGSNYYYKYISLRTFPNVNLYSISKIQWKSQRVNFQIQHKSILLVMRYQNITEGRSWIPIVPNIWHKYSMVVYTSGIVQVSCTSWPSRSKSVKLALPALLPVKYNIILIYVIASLAYFLARKCFGMRLLHYMNT